MKQKTSFYFVLYLVAIVNLLDVITERDDAQLEMVKILVHKITAAPVIAVRDTVVWFSKDTNRTILVINGLETRQEKASVRYTLVPIDALPDNSLLHEVRSDSGGNGILVGNIAKKGNYRFQAYCTVDRDLPHDLPEAVREVIRRQLGTEIPLESNPVSFVVKVEGAGAAPPALALNIEPPKEDKWVVGIPYAKTIYVAGPQPDIVDFRSSDYRFVITKDIGKIHVTWSNPVVTKNPIPVTITANANRDAGTLDQASLTFSVAVTPPRWDPEPVEQAYWDVPYVFNSAVRGLEPDKYTVQILANGTPIKSIAPIEFPYTLTPERTWNQLSFRALSTTETELVKTDIVVKKPLPPQIRWTGSTWQGDDYIVRFTSSDVNNREVTVDYCAVVQPDGIASRLDARHGRSFTLIISNLKATRPSAIRIKATVSGIGGHRTDIITQPILY